MPATNFEITRDRSEQEMHTIAKQALSLATGLQNIAPAAGGGSKSIVYLNETAKQLEETCEKLKEMAASTSQRPGI